MKNKKPKTKVCIDCKKRMPIKAFVPRYDHQGGYRGWCIKCNTIRIKQKKIKLRKMVSDYKKSKGCKNCDYNDPRALCLHHTNPKNKKMDISNLISRSYSAGAVKKEMEKCEVLCANCHAILHHEEHLSKRKIG